MVPGVSTRRTFDRQDPALGGADFDYADCFEMSAAAPEERAMESLARAALEGGPLALRIVTPASDHVVLDADGPLMRQSWLVARPGPA